MLTGKGSGSASETTESSAICSSTSPVGSLGLTVSGERSTTLPVNGHDAFEAQRVGCAKSGPAMSMTHCVTP